MIIMDSQAQLTVDIITKVAERKIEVAPITWTVNQES